MNMYMMIIPKTDTKKETIKSRYVQSFIFNAIEDQDMISLIDAFEEKRYKVGEYVIKEGEQGDIVFLLKVPLATRSLFMSLFDKKLIFLIIYKVCYLI